MKKTINKLKLLMEDINISGISEHAASCAYYTILAFIPLIILILTLTKYFGIDESFFIYVLEGMIPGDILNEAVISIVKEVQTKSVGTITISALVTLWSAGKGFFALCKGLSSAYDVQYENKFMQFRLRGLVSTIIFIISVILSLLLLVFGNGINIFLQQRFNIYSKVINLILKSKIIISVVSLSIILTIMYRFIPKNKYRLKKHIPGALISSILFYVISIFYSIYVDVFTGFSLMYGSLATIVFAMMWVYGCMYVILLGASINKLIL